MGPYYGHSRQWLNEEETMAVTIPIKDLKDTSGVADLCQSQDDPVQVTRNGRTAFYLVKPETMDAMERALAMQSLYARLEHSEAQFDEGVCTDYDTSMAELRNRHDL